MDYRIRALLIAALWLAFDQLTKMWASARLDFDDAIVIIPSFLRFIRSHNTGALFGVMGNLDTPLRTILLVGLPLVAVVVVGVLIWRIPRHEVLARYGLALILGGAIGNLIDRLLYGHVVDFIDVYAGWKPLAEFFISWFETNRWPTFNIADVGLVCGACLLVAELFFGRKTGAGDARTEEDTRAPLSD